MAYLLGLVLEARGRKLTLEAAVALRLQRCDYYNHVEMVSSRGEQLTIRQPTTRLLMEYLIATYPRGGYRTNVPLGPVVAAAVDGLGQLRGAAASRPFRPKVDALVFTPGSLTIVEAKEPVHAKGIGDLLYYRVLIPETPELTSWHALPIELVLVVPWTTPALATAAPRLGVRLVEFRPAWYARRVEDLNNYWTPEATARREDLKRARRVLGVE